MKSLMKRYQIPIFFVLTLLIGWFPWYTGGGGIIIVAPMLAGLIVATLAEGKNGVLAVLRRMARWRAHVRWYIIILLFPVLTSLVAVGVHVLLGGTAPQFPLLKQNQHLILLTFMFYLLPWHRARSWKRSALEAMRRKSHKNDGGLWSARSSWGPLLARG
jgi:hypothetical protein